MLKRNELAKGLGIKHQGVRIANSRYLIIQLQGMTKKSPGIAVWCLGIDYVILGDKKRRLSARGPRKSRRGYQPQSSRQC